MMPSATIEKLSTLLSDEERVEDRIRQTEDTLANVKRKIAESLVRHYITMKEEKAPMPEELLQEEQSYERLLRALLDIKNDIVKQIRPLEEQIVRAHIEHLRQTFEREKKRLEECLVAIDQKLLDCRQPLEEYGRIRFGLQTFNDKISRLGESPLPVPDSLPTEDLAALIQQRLDQLKAEGKI